MEQKQMILLKELLRLQGVLPNKIRVPLNFLESESCTLSDIKHMFDGVLKGLPIKDFLEVFINAKRDLTFDLLRNGNVWYCFKVSKHEMQRVQKLVIAEESNNDIEFFHQERDDGFLLRLAVIGDILCFPDMMMIEKGFVYKDMWNPVPCLCSDCDEHWIRMLRELKKCFD